MCARGAGHGDSPLSLVSGAGPGAYPVSPGMAGVDGSVALLQKNAVPGKAARASLRIASVKPIFVPEPVSVSAGVDGTRS